MATLADLWWSYGQFARYATWSPRWVGIPLSDRAKPWLAALRQDGIVRIDTPALRAVARALDQRYFGPLAAAGPLPAGDGLFAVPAAPPDAEALGMRVFHEISFTEPALSPLLFHADIAAVLYRYYRRQPYFRNQPVLQRAVAAPGTDRANVFHADALRQLSLMLLVSDTTEATTHLEYARGSHRRPMWRRGIPLAAGEAERLADKCPRVSAVGPPGTLWIFDACGVHRRVAGAGERRVLHFNVTTGHTLRPFRETLAGWPALDGLPRHMARLFARVLCYNR